MTLVRRARPEDAPAVTGLIGELGYATETDDVRDRIAGLPAGHVVLVATDGERLTGWLQARHGLSLVHGERLEIVGLAVSRDWRGRGVGGVLVDAAERWALDRGLGSAQVLSGSERAAAHRFYARRGYRRVKSEQVFVKALTADRAWAGQGIPPDSLDTPAL
ncbi:GNAT family N-acetyltransferase [Micromonospora sp. NPDC049799]|uniref:GNAT family N-acetyltransferase n=1 Tax=Micromonospora sp. NPDC049799 TaxID=3154741 RepID=UPI0033F75D23